MCFEKSIKLDFGAKLEDLQVYEGRKVRLETYMTESWDGILRILSDSHIHLKVEGDPLLGDVEANYTEEFNEMKSEGVEFDKELILDGLQPDILRIYSV